MGVSSIDAGLMIADLQKKYVACLGLLWAAVTPLHAQPDPEQPVYIRADEAVMDEDAGVFHCSGHVRIEQPGMDLEADDMTVRFAGNQLGRIKAKGGPVSYREQHAGSGPVTAEGREFVYVAADNRILLTGDARVLHEGNQLSGDRIVYDLTAHSAKAESAEGSAGRGVRTMLLPSSELVQDKLLGGGD